MKTENYELFFKRELNWKILEKKIIIDFCDVSHKERRKIIHSILYVMKYMDNNLFCKKRCKNN